MTISHRHSGGTAPITNPHGMLEVGYRRGQGGEMLGTTSSAWKTFVERRTLSAQLIPLRIVRHTMSLVLVVGEDQYDLFSLPLVMRSEIFRLALVNGSFDSMQQSALLYC